MVQNLIAHAVNDENHEDYMGFLGDQLGYEVGCTKYYEYPSGGWACVYRTSDTEKAEGMASFMEELICNGFVGYDQNRTRRRAFIDALKAIDFNLDELAENVSGDCGAVMYAVVYSQYRIDATNASVDGNGNPAYGVPTVTYFHDYLLNDLTGFEKIVDEEYLASSANLRRGDILISSGNTHIAMWI